MLNLARFHKDVINQEAEGKVIWQPRIQCWIDDKKYKGEKLPEPYNRLSKPDMYRELGCSARIYEYNRCFERIEDERVKQYSEKISENVVKYIKETPVGTISTVVEKVSSTWASKTKDWWINSEEDMKVAIWMEARCRYKWNQNHFEKTQKKWGNLGAPTIYMPRVNIQHLYIDMMGIKETTYALFDYPDTVEKYFDILDQSHQRLIEVINRSPIDIINFGDNVHAGTLSPDLFKKYVLSAYQKRNHLLHKANKFTHAHWDGDTKTLLPFARATGLDGIEAITPRPQGDVTLEEVKKHLGDDMFLIDGIAAVLFNDTYDLEQLKKQTRKVIRLFAPKLILGISDELPSNGNIERIKVIGEMVDNFNAKGSNK